MKHPDWKRLMPQLLGTLSLTAAAAGACLLAAASYNGFRMPLGTAIAAALPPVYGLAVLAGSIFTYALTGMLMREPVLICALAVSVLLRWLTGRRCPPKMSALLASGSILLSAMIFTLAGLSSLHDWAVLGLGSAAAGLAALCIAAVRVRCEGGLPLRINTAEALPFAVCYVMGAAALCSLRLFMLNFGAMLTGAVLLTFAKRFRCTGGVAAGTLSACALLLADASAAGMAAVLPAAGLCAGYLSEKRSGVLYAVLQGFCALGLLISGRSAAAAGLWVNLLIGGLVFVFLPLGEWSALLLRWRDAESELGALTGARMEFLSRSIGGVRGSAERIANMLSKNDLPRSAADRVCETVCSKCRSRATCWESGNDSTKRRFREMADSEPAAPLAAPEGCLKPERITEEFAKAKRRSAAARVHAARLRESQTLLFSQMRITEELLHRAGQQSRRTYHRDLTRFVTGVLDRYRIPYLAAAVSVSPKQRLLIELYAAAEEKLDPALIAECLKDALHRPLAVTGFEQAGSEQRLILRSAGGYQVSTAAAQCAVQEDEPCGDCWDTFTDSEGAVYLVVSDGMGSGRHAAVDARIVISSFRQLVQSGMDCEAAARMVNAIMLTKSGEERFATLDVAKICTDTAAVTLYKYGAGPTLIKHGERITLCQAATSPIGILPSAEPYTTVLRLDCGDMLFLLSDGLDDSLYPYIRQRLAQGGDLQTLAHTVCSKAQRDAKGAPRDDVTVLAASISAMTVDQ